MKKINSTKKNKNDKAFADREKLLNYIKKNPGFGPVKTMTPYRSTSTLTAGKPYQVTMDKRDRWYGAKAINNNGNIVTTALSSWKEVK